MKRHASDYGVRRMATPKKLMAMPLATSTRRENIGAPIAAKAAAPNSSPSYWHVPCQVLAIVVA